ncbi:DUF4124 domain-containing protein [Halomonas sp. SH5A2]|uniref:DUF4124 domain-containing protein n=1 Tax=Halomonas sp. SH5A2 TaxID=2749040 RepID=UPI00163EF047|nr:DUF4124 domain-containing protein [Halomonas sp. SH5A2]
MKKRSLLVFLALLPLSAQAELYKCVTNGHTTFQDFPCESGNAEPIQPSGISIYTPPDLSPQPRESRSVTPQPNRSRNNSSASSDYQSTTERRNAEVRARTRGVVIPGMSERQAISILGKPANISTRTRNGRTCRYLYWDGSRPFQDGYHRVTICGGEVSSYTGR